MIFRTGHALSAGGEIRMAKLKYSYVDGVDPDIELNYEAGDLGLIFKKKTSASYVGVEEPCSVVFEGTGLKYTLEDGLVKGTVTEIHFLDGDSKEFATISGLNISKVKKLEDTLLGFGGDDGVGGLLAKLLAGNDTIIGTNRYDVLNGEAGNDNIQGKRGDDTIEGNGGNDTMSGGSGNDRFDFYGASGKDVITDFNVGDEENYDTILIRDVLYDLVRGADNFLKIKFGDGSSVVLEHVRYADRNDVHIDAFI